MDGWDGMGGYAPVLRTFAEREREKNRHGQRLSAKSACVPLGINVSL
jgi:hypothetical protein